MAKPVLNATDAITLQRSVQGKRKPKKKSSCKGAAVACMSSSSDYWESSDDGDLTACSVDAQVNEICSDNKVNDA